jgi:hypothetical protein
MRYVIEVDCENEQNKYIPLCCEQDSRNKLEGVTSPYPKTYGGAWIDGHIEGKIEGYTDDLFDGLMGGDDD